MNQPATDSPVTNNTNNHTGVARISVSLPEGLLQQLDGMVSERGFESRSHAIVNMIHQQITEHHKNVGNEIMAGTITLVYRHATPGLQQHLSDIQHSCIDEVISSLHVNLMDAQTMEVILVQGPASTLKSITDRMVACRGVISGKLLMSAAVIPQIHPLPETALADVE